MSKAEEGKTGGKAILRVAKLSAINKEEAGRIREIVAKYGLDLARPRDLDEGPTVQSQECGTHSCSGFQTCDSYETVGGGKGKTRCSAEACDTQSCGSHICSSNACDTNACQSETCNAHEEKFQSLYSAMQKDSPALAALQAITTELKTDDWGSISLSTE